jgi:hypothetical protein
LGNFLQRMERRLAPFAIPHLTPLVIAGQAVCFFLGQANPQFSERLVLVPQNVANGEVWRLVSFLFLPPCGNPLFAFFAWYLFWLMGTALENRWGALRYNVFLLVSYVATVAVVFLAGIPAVTNVYLFASVFLVFAYYYPDFPLALFFVIPVPIKFLAGIQWLTYLFLLVNGGMTARLIIPASLANFFLFVGPELAARVRNHRRRVGYQRRVAASREQFVHRCTICGITDKTHPKVDFRFCTKCDGDFEYCQNHIRNHEHRIAPADAAVGASANDGANRG